MAKEFSAGEAYDAYWRLEMLRKYGSQREVARLEVDPDFMAMVNWAKANPKKSPLQVK